ncbi:MAG: molybdopterin-dependent oxidoreductase [Nitrososphaerota archaeon]
MVNRRAVVKGIIGAVAIGTFTLGYSEVFEKIVRPTTKLYGPDKLNGIRYVYSSCLGCNVRCGIRVRVASFNGQEVIEKIEGNPYHVYNRAVVPRSQRTRIDPITYDTPIEKSLKYTGTLCARGLDGIHYVYDPYRVLKPLKRAGPRGSGKWKIISWEQLIKEVVEGGVIEETGERLPGFKEIFVTGRLRAAGFEDPNGILSEMKKDVDEVLKIASDPRTSYADVKSRLLAFKEKWQGILAEKGLKLDDVLIDPDRPDLGTKSNELVFMRGRGQDNADVFTRRFIFAFGSVNWLRHTSACQLGFYTGNKLWSGTYDISPDILSSKVLIMAGACMGRIHPGATGQGILVERAARGELKVYYVNPIAPRTTANGNIVWVPIKPGTDAALTMAVARWLIENNRINHEFLEIPNLKAAEEVGYPYHSDATWLVIAEEGHEEFGSYVLDKYVGVGENGKPLVASEDGLKAYDSVKKAKPFYSEKVRLITGEEVTVKTALQMFKEEAFSRSLEEWSTICGVPVAVIVEMANTFANAAPYAATYIHRGVAQHPHGEYSVWALRALDILIGNYHRKGGLLSRPGTTRYVNYLYNLGDSGFGEPLRWGPPIDRHGVEYEKTLEYLLKVKKEESPYPAKRPWYPHPPEESYTEMFAGIAEAYPYPVRALVLYFANPVLSVNYGTKFVEVLKDTNRLPLFIGITTTINETYIYADYIVPDTTYLETGTSGVQFLYASGAGRLLAESWRTPTIMPLTEEIGNSPNKHPRHASMWEFFIDVGKALGMPGYGEKAIPGTKGKKYEGEWFPMHSYWDYILRVYANGAVDAQDRGLVPKDVPRNELEFVEKNYPIASFKEVLPKDEWQAVAYPLARGGVFTTYEESFDEKGFSRRSVAGTRVLQFWNEKLAKTCNSITGAKFWGGPKYFMPATYAPVAGKTRKDKWIHGTLLRELYPESEYPFFVVFESGPLYTKHRGNCYYWIKQILPENFIVINPQDAEIASIKPGDVVRIETPVGSFEAPVLLETTVRRGVILVPYGMGRWAETVILKPKYFEVYDGTISRSLEELPDRADLPDEAMNPVKRLPELTKVILFTDRPLEYYNVGKTVDEWRFNGVSPNVVLQNDVSLGGWPLLSWLSAAQSYYANPAKITKTGKRKELVYTQRIW